MLLLLLLPVLVWCSRLKISLGLLEDLLDTDRSLAIQFIREKQSEHRDYFEHHIIPYIPMLVRIGASEVLEAMPKERWTELATRKRWSHVRRSLLNMFPSDLQNRLMQLFGKEGGMAAGALPTLLCLWRSIEPFYRTSLLGEVIAGLPPEILQKDIFSCLGIREEIILSQTCHTLLDLLRPIIREKYMTTNSFGGFHLSIRRLHERWLEAPADSHQKRSLAIQLCSLKAFHKFAPWIIGDEVPGELLLGRSWRCLLDKLVRKRVHPDIVFLLLTRHPGVVLAGFKAKHFVMARFMEYPEEILLLIIREVEELPSKVLLAVIGMEGVFSKAIIEAALQRYDYRLTREELDFVLLRLDHVDLLERILGNIPPMGYVYRSVQLRHFLRVGVGRPAIERILACFKVAIADDCTLQGLLRLRIPEPILMNALERCGEGKARFSSKSVKIAIQQDYGDELVGLLIRMAQKPVRTAEEPDPEFDSRELFDIYCECMLVIGPF